MCFKGMYGKVLCAAVCMTVSAILFVSALTTQMVSGFKETNAVIIAAQYFVAFLFLGCAKACVKMGGKGPVKRK